MSPEERLSRLEQRQVAVFSVLPVVIFILTGVAGYQAYRLHELATTKSLRVRELTVYDENGVDRVVISGRLPQARVDGKIVDRGVARSMAGLLIYDGSGTERGGYVTANGYANALLTLDAKGHQTFLLLAEPAGGSLLRQWDGNSSVTMGVFDDKPFLTVKEGEDVILAKPENNPWVSRELR